MYPWRPSAHILWEYQGIFELDGLVLHRWRKVGSIEVQQWLSRFFPWAFLGGAVWVQVWWLVFAGQVEDEIRPQWVAHGLILPRELAVGRVD